MQNSRRDFFKKVAGIASAVVVAPAVVNGLFSSVANAEGKRGGAAGGGLPLVEPGKDMAATVNYVHNAKDIKDAKLKTERQGVKFEQQNCAGCMLYTKEGMQGGVEVGKCSIFAGKVVKSTGWCTSWAKKA